MVKGPNINHEADAKKENELSKRWLTSTEIVKTFADKQKKEVSDSYFKNSNKETIVNDFNTYVTTKYGKEMLTALHAQGTLDSDFNSIAHKWFSINDFAQSWNKRNTIKQRIGNKTHEVDEIQNSALSCYKKRSTEPKEIKDKLPFVDFLKENNLLYDTDDTGTITNIHSNKNSRIQTMVDLEEKWKNFVRWKLQNTEQINHASSLMDTSQFDPSEKIVCVTVARQLYNQIQELSGSKRGIASEIWHDIFGKQAHANNPISALEEWTRFDGLQKALEEFFNLLSQNWYQKKEIDKLKDLSIDPKVCLYYGDKTGELPKGSYEGALQSNKFVALGNKAKKLTDQIVSTNLVTSIDKSLEQIDSKVNDFVNFFTMPGDMAKFFGQFETALDPKSNKEYQTLHQRESRLRDLIADYTGPKEEEYRAMQRELVSIGKEKNKFLTEKITTSRDGLFAHIAHSTLENIKLIGRTPDQAFALHLQQVLEKLRTGQWNSSSLNKDEQNILSKASVFAQLAKVKQSGITQDLSMNFDNYAQFVSDLFDLNSTESIIETKDHVPIVLKFSKKEIVGSVPNRQDITPDKLMDLKALRMQFEIDCTNNPDAKNFIRAITGNEKSKVIPDFFGTTDPEIGKHLPAMLSESSKVKMTHSDGTVYEWYLSPVDIEDEDKENSLWWASNEQSAAKTYVLYSHPTDQVHDKREIKTRDGEKSENGKLIPVSINPDNLKDWNIDILEDKVTLSGDHINALARWHAITQHQDAQDPLNKQFILSDKELENKIESFWQDNFEDRWEGDSWEISEAGSSAEKWPHQQFMDERKKLFPNSDGETNPPQEGMRFVAKMPDDIKVRSWDSGNDEILSLTIKDTKKDSEGRVIGCTFWRGNLTRATKKLKLKDLSVAADGLWKAEEMFSLSYLDSNAKEKDLASTVSSLKGHPLFKEKNYNRSTLEKLNFKDGVFDKGGKTIKKFIAIEKWKDETGKKKGNIEYEIKKKSHGLYTITSTGYSVEIDDPDSKEKKTKRVMTHFETTTNLEWLALIIANNKLTAYTDEEYQIHQAGGEWGWVIPEVKRKLWSLWTVYDFLKWWGKTLIEAFEKKREETGKEAFEHLMHTELNIYRRLEGKFGSFLEKFDLNFLDDIADEKEAAAEQKDWGHAWKKIEGQLNQLKKFHHSYNYGIVGDDNGSTGASRMAHDVFSSAMDAYNNNGWVVPYKLRYKTASSLLYMLDKFKTGYAKEFKDYPRGSYVKILMWWPAYEVFLEKYKEKEKEIEGRFGKYDSQVQEMLMSFEYNFIADNIRWGWLQEERVRDLNNGNAPKPNPNSRYFQRLYGRKFWGALGEATAGIKGLVWAISKDDKDVKNLVDWANFEHIKNEFYDHISANRLEEALREFVAFQYVATNKDQGDEVLIAFMTGMLSGVFSNGLGKDAREMLKVACRNSAIPFPAWAEHIDAPEKIAALLQLATSDMGKDSFQNKVKYNEFKDNVNPFTDNSEKDDKGETKNPRRKFVNNFSGKESKGWLRDPDVNKRVISFLHMDKMDDDNNLINAWKNDDAVIFGNKVSPEAKAAVGSMMNELYFNDDRGANMDNYNFATWLNHTRTTIHNFYRDHNSIKDGKYAGGKWDHLETIWYAIDDKSAPNPEEKIVSDTQQYKLAHHVDEFFRVFQNIGKMEHNKEFIAWFYKAVRLAQEQKNSEDQKRILWFYTTKKLYANGPVPANVEWAFVKYMKYFENNLSKFKKQTGEKHADPTNSGSNLGYAFDEKLDEIYMPSQVRKDIYKNSGELNEMRRNATAQWLSILNEDMQSANESARGKSNRWYQSSGSIQMTIDNKIKALRGEKETTTTTIKHAHANNKSDIEREFGSAEKKTAPNYHTYLPKKPNDAESMRKKKEADALAKVLDQASPEDLAEAQRNRGY